MRISATLAQAFASVCGCHSCSALRTDILHQTGRNATRHNGRSGPPTTFVFSAMFSIAASADAHIKKRRREQLDAAIAEAEQSLHEPGQGDAKPSFNQESPSSPEQSNELISTDKETSAVFNDLPLSPSHTVGAKHHNALVNAVLSYLDPIRPHFPHSWCRNLGLHRGSLFVSGQEKAVREERWSSKKLITLELSVAKLVAALKIEASKLSPQLGDQRRQQELATARDALAEQLKRLVDVPDGQTEFIQRPPLPRYSPDSAHALNDEKRLIVSLRESLGKIGSGNISFRQAMAEISHALMTNPHPPDQEAYSTLIDGFSLLKHFGLANLAVEAMTEGHRRLDESGVVRILNHFRRSGDRDKFNDFRLRLSGVRTSLFSTYWQHDSGFADPLATARKGASALGLHQSRSVHTALLSAYMKFRMTSEALSLYRVMSQASLQPSNSVLIALMRYLRIEGRLSAASDVWARIQTNIFSKVDRHSESDEADLQAASREALRLYAAKGTWDEFRALRSATSRLVRSSARRRERPDALTTFETWNSLVHQRELLEEQVDFAETRVYELCMEAAAVRYIFDSGHSVRSLRKAFLRYGQHPDYVSWAVDQVRLGQHVWLPATWNQSFGFRRNGTWHFRRRQKTAASTHSGTFDPNVSSSLPAVSRMQEHSRKNRTVQGETCPKTTARKRTALALPVYDLVT